MNGSGEFEVIQRYFYRPPTRAEVCLGGGDDCALLTVPPDQYLAVTTDTLVENVHFLPFIAPADLAYKAVAVNLSDLAAMGATPTWLSLALTLPKIDHHWLSAFSRSLFDTLAAYGVELIGGDTTQGALHVLSLTAQGVVPKTHALCRHGAKAGDWIYVSGTLGDSAAGLQWLPESAPKTATETETLNRNENRTEKAAETPLNGADISASFMVDSQPAATVTQQSAVDFCREFLIHRHLRPTPRVALGIALAQSRWVTAAVDISDGLLADLGHILNRSRVVNRRNVAAVLDTENLPLSPSLRHLFGQAQAEHLALTGGEDYELCFTVADQNKAEFDRTFVHHGGFVQADGTATPVTCPITCIGRIVARQPDQPLIRLQRHGNPVAAPLRSGFDHFNVKGNP